MEQLNLSADSRSRIDEGGFKVEEVDDSIDSEAQQQELLDAVCDLKTDAVDKDTDELVKKALSSAGITNRMRLPPAS